LGSCSAPSTTNSLSATTNNCNNDDNNTKEESNNEELVDTIIYASSGIINIATSYPPSSSTNNNNTSITNYNNVTSVNETLVTRTLDYSLIEASEGEGEGKKKLLARGEAVEDAAANRSITALSWVSTNSNTDNNNDNNNNSVKKEENEVYGIIAAYSDGTVTSHRYHNNLWSEHVIVGNDPLNPATNNNDNNTNNRIYIHNYQESLNKSKLHESISGKFVLLALSCDFVCSV